LACEQLRKTFQHQGARNSGLAAKLIQASVSLQRARLPPAPRWRFVHVAAMPQVHPFLDPLLETRFSDANRIDDIDTDQIEMRYRQSDP
jgi:hypothetical protein